MRSMWAFVSGLCVIPVLLVLLVAAFADEASLPHTFVAGTPARATEVNENFEALRDAIRKSSPRRAELAYSDHAEDVTLTSSFERLRTFGSFVKKHPDTDLLLTWNSRIELLGNLWDFVEVQLRIDGNANAADTGRAYVQTLVDGGIATQAVSITALFRGLAAGSRTIELWVRGGTAGVEVFENTQLSPTSVLVEESHGH